ncbi:MAG TPA: carboxypeptidase-like regulatory domain-containing protein, partial [Sphingobacteriaceae bacterium]
MMKKKLLLFFTVIMCTAGSLFAQGQIIQGRVTASDDNRGLPGVSVLVKGTTTGVTTDVNGDYRIQVPSGSSVLVFRFIGYAEQEVTATGRTTINVTLSPDNQQLSEVIVVAYGTSTKGTYTGSAAVVAPNKDIPATSFENALNGRVAGAQITSSSGQAGSAPNIRIRGIGSMNATNEPLYVIDGVPVVSGNAGQLGTSDYYLATNNVMSSINPADIETITILKDAAASSLYGSRAANGVVLITTKKGKSGKPVVNFKSSFGISPKWATDNFEAAGVQEQTNMLYRVFHDLNTSAGKTAAVANTDALNRLNSRFNKHGYKFSTTGTALSENVMISGMTDGMVNREGTYFDWEDALFRTAAYQTNDLSVSGGDQNTSYYSSFSYTRDQSRIRINDFDRLSGRINLAQKVGKYVEFISNVNIARTGQTGFNDSRNTGSNYFMQSRNLLWPFYWPTD